MSSESTYLLRLKAPATKEIKVTAVDVFGDPALFTSQLTSGYTRKAFQVYNNTADASGECGWGPADVTADTAMILPKGVVTDIPCSTDLDVYFCNTLSGELGNLRVVELA